VAVFALGPVQDPHNDYERDDSWGQLKNELAVHPWLEPVAWELFGGKYAPEKLRFPLKMFAGSAPASDICDWDTTRVWASSDAGQVTPDQHKRGG
jgi:menaquinone-dependent protoporphyrinogen IX oxidase